MSSTPTKKSSPAKGPAAKVSAPKKAAVVDAPAAVATTPGEAVGHLRLKDLVDRVVAATGVKPKEGRDLVLATLAELAASLDRGDAINLPELGKIRVARRGDAADGTTSMVLKLRRGGPSGPRNKEGQEALAVASE